MYRRTGARRRNEGGTRAKHSVQVHGISRWAAYTRESERIRAGEIGLTRRCLGTHTHRLHKHVTRTHRQSFVFVVSSSWVGHDPQFQNQSQSFVGFFML